MIYQLARDVASELHERGFPVDVKYGAERVARRGVGRLGHTVVFERDTTGGDTIDPPVGARAQTGARTRMRAVGVQITIYASAGKAGALRYEHERECDKIVDGVIVALSDWASKARTFQPEFVGSRYLTDDEIHGAETTPGAVYRLRLTVARAVNRKDYDGSVEPTREIDGLSPGLSVVTDSAVITVEGEQEETI